MDPPTTAAHPRALHLRPTAELAERVLLPGDPGRALALAQALIESPRMFNHHRGLWGYTGLALADGEPLTIQATGMGGPSAAIVLSELISLGARCAIRVGTCGALAQGLGFGELVVAREAICRDGASRALWAGERVAGDPGLTGALARAAEGAYAGTVVSVDLFYEPGPHDRMSWQGGEDVESENGKASTHGDSLTRGGATHDALAIEMEAATLFAIGARAQIPVGCVLAVSDTFDARGARTHIDDHALLQAAERMGAVAVAALAGVRNAGGSPYGG
jgi:uridine phosphorylase